MTCFFDAGRVRELMNRCGARRRPFLFAVNFEMTEGLFAENPLACSSVGFSVNGVGNREGMAGKSGSGAALLEARPMEFAEYARRFGTPFPRPLAAYTNPAPSQTRPSREELRAVTRQNQHLGMPVGDNRTNERFSATPARQHEPSAWASRP